MSRTDEQADSSNTQTDEDGQGVAETLESLKSAGDESDGDGTSVGDVLEAFGSRAYGPLLLIPALLALIPLIGGIPGASILLATIIILVAGQMLFRSEGLWMPKKIKSISISSDKINEAVDRSLGTAKTIDGFVDERLGFMTGSAGRVVAALACIALAITMYPLAAVPMGVAPPAAAISLLALAITAKDGVLMTIGLFATVGCGGFAWWMWG